MKPAPFTYHAPRTVDETTGLLADLGDASKVLAGGQSLVPVLNMRLAQPAHLVDINGIAGLDRIEVTDEHVSIGALVRHADLERHESAHCALPLLRQALRWVAHPAIRSRGTTVGSIAHADPSGEMPAVLVLTDGVVRIASARGGRTVAAADFFLAPMESVLEPDELVVGVDFPLFVAGTRTAYSEIARRSGDYALAGVAVAVEVHRGLVRRARASFVSVTDTPDVLDLTPALAGMTVPEGLGADADAAADADLDPERLRSAGELARKHVQPDADIHASADYRRHLVEVFTRRVTKAALARPTQEDAA